MNKAMLKNITIDHKTTVKEALTAINKGAMGICLVTDNKRKFLGVITDGDLRRGFIIGLKVSDKISKVVNKKAVFALEDTPAEKILNLFSEKIKYIPILDKNRHVVDVLSFVQKAHIPIAQPLLGNRELEYVSECILTGWISSAGRFIPLFEEKFARYIGTKYAVACSNGTTALHLALTALAIGPENEVIVPTLTFIASANSVHYTGARPVFVDSEEKTWNLDPGKIEKLINKKTKAIMPVHLYGHPCQMDEINRIAKKYNLYVIEDAAEAIGSEYKNNKVGSIGDVGCFSFYGNKTITTGEGGMITTNDKDLYEKLLILRDHGMSKERRYYHPVIGFNYRMTNMQAAVGVAQMERIERLVSRKIEMANLYNQCLKNIKNITLPPKEKWAKNTYWMYSILINSDSPVSRDLLIAKLKEKGVETRPFFIPVHLMPPYATKISYPVAEKLSKQGLNIPSYAMLNDKDIKNITEEINKILAKNG